MLDLRLTEEADGRSVRVTPELAPERLSGSQKPTTGFRLLASAFRPSRSIDAEAR